MKKAQMGGSYAARRAYKGANNNPPKSPARPKTAVIKSAPSKNKANPYGDYRAYSEREVENYTPTPRDPVKPAPKRTKVAKSGPTVDQKKKEFNKNNPSISTLPKREFPSMSKPSVPGIGNRPEGRKFSDKEIKIMQVMKKGTKKNGTMKASAQRKISKIRRSK